MLTRSVTIGLLALGLALSASASAQPPVSAPHDTLKAFKSDADILAFLKRHAPKHNRGAKGGVLAEMIPNALPAPPPPPASAVGQVESVAVVGGRSAPSITNNQEAGVDEGDIVKKRGDILVVLRRGRLFTVSLAHGGMRPVDFINAYPPGVDASDDWYDEMLIHGDRIVVIGYSYGRGGVEINRFHLGDDGHLAFQDAYQLRANDYYSSRNYASRLVGNRLIFYSPLYVGFSRDALDQFPALRRWTGDLKGKFARIVSPRRVYAPPFQESPDVLDVEALHTVTDCDVTAPVLDCEATSVFGPSSRSFYVSGNAVYVWAAAGYNWHRPARPGLLFRMPLDGGAPSAIGVRGAPTDQFSFREDPGLLNVLVRAGSAGDAMWNGEHSEGAVALLRLPLSAFGDGSEEAPIADYRGLPSPAGEAYNFHNRFAGDYVLYGLGNGWGSPEDARSLLTVARLGDGRVTQLPLEHGIDRIELMGPDALVVGSDSASVTFSAIELGREPHLGDAASLASASQAETRSHAFFYKPESPDGSDGVIGLPVAREGRPQYHQLFENSVAMVYLRWSGRRFRPLGELDASTSGFADDACVASCVDWYGNARPIFLPERSFALMGYELVEGALSDRAIRETNRISFAPPPAREGRNQSNE
jgi:hypothetical protein